MGNQQFSGKRQAADDLEAPNRNVRQARPDNQEARDRGRAVELYRRVGLPRGFDRLDRYLKFQLMRDLDRRTIQHLCMTSSAFDRFCNGWNEDYVRVEEPIWDRLLVYRFGGPAIGAFQASPLNRLRAHMYMRFLLDVKTLVLESDENVDSTGLGTVYPRLVYSLRRGDDVVLDIVQPDVAFFIHELRGRAVEEGVYPAEPADATYLARQNAFRGGAYLAPDDPLPGGVTRAVFRWRVGSPDGRAALVDWLGVLLEEGFAYAEYSVLDLEGNHVVKVTRPSAELVRGTVEGQIEAPVMKRDYL